MMFSRLRIGDLTLDTGQRLLLRDSKPIPLARLTYRLLLTLVEAAPNMVSHDELINSVWGGRSVSPETISQRIKLLRDALSDDPHSPRYLELVRGQGYKLLPRVEVLANQSPARHRPRWVVPIAAAISLAAAAAIVFWIVTAPTGAVRQSTSIAVLPFVDLSPARDQQYFADGIAEAILNLLSKATTLRVIARTSSFSFRGKDADVRRIAEVLGVTHVLEGSVRKEGERIRVTVRLVDAVDGGELWSESYDQGVGSILALQTDVARSVSAALKANLQNDVADPAARHVKAEAYDLYLRGQKQLRGASFKDAAGYFEQAIAVDSEFVPGYYALGMAYVLQVANQRVAVAENRVRLREVVRDGQRLAPDDPGLLALSGQLARYDGEIQLAEERFATALRKDPSNSVVRQLYAVFKLDQSNPEEALALSRRSLEIDPLNTVVHVTIWASYLDLGNIKEAMAAATHYRELMPPSDPWRDCLAFTARWYLSGDLAGSKSFINRVAWLGAAEEDVSKLPIFYYFIEDLQTGDALTERVRRARIGPRLRAIEAYRHLAHGDIHEARRLAVSALTAPKIWGGDDEDVIIVRLATDALIESGEAQRVIDFLESLAPEYARYKTSGHIDPRDFSPAPVPLKSAFSSYPALYFPDYIRALRAVGDEAGANRMLDHLDAILELRRKRGLFIEERHAAEALALRGRTEAALDALENGERDRTIYHRWQLALLHNEIFAGFRNHPRFVALVERVQRDLSRQRQQLESAKN